MRTFEAIVEALSNIKSANWLRLHNHMLPHILHFAGFCQNAKVGAVAEFLLEQVLAWSEQGLGPMHPRAAVDLYDLALQYGAGGKYVEAERLLKRALAIRERALGTMHPSTANSMNNLAILYHMLGKDLEAKSLLKRARAISERVLGREHPSTQIKRENYIHLLQAIRSSKPPKTPLRLLT